MGSVVLPADLVSAVRESTATNGWFGGSRIVSERVFVVTHVSIDDKVTVSKHKGSLLSHRAFEKGFGEEADELVRWVRVSAEVSKTIRWWSVVPTADLERDLGIQLGTKQPVCILEDGDGEFRPRAAFFMPDSASTYIFPSHLTLLSESWPYPRVPATTVEKLSSTNVAIVGMGSGGSEIAINLACAGVGTLNLIDYDYLEPENYIRHILDRQDLGRRKVHGVETALQNRDLPIAIGYHVVNVLGDADAFRENLEKGPPDLLICATDGRRSRRFLNYYAVRMGIPLLVAGLLDGGIVGEVLLVLPGTSACYECVRLQLGAELEKPTSEERPDTPYAGGEADTSQTVIHRFDVAFVAGLATRIALQVLDPSDFEAVPTKYLTWGRERREGSGPFAFDLPLSVNFVPVDKRGDCPVCGTPAPELDGVDIDEAYRAIMQELDHVSA